MRSGVLKVWRSCNVPLVDGTLPATEGLSPCMTAAFSSPPPRAWATVDL
jgi:hypothetical protein